MRVVNTRRETITEYDLTKGRLVPTRAKAEDGSLEEVQMYIPDRTIPNSVKIRSLKRQLSATDYKVIKCAECQLLGLEMPYDVEVLHAQRQGIRDQINRLEQEGKPYEDLES